MTQTDPTALVHTPPYQDLLERISSTYAQGRTAAMQAVNVQLLQTYWQVGQHIVEFEQQGQSRVSAKSPLSEKRRQPWSLSGLRH